MSAILISKALTYDIMLTRIKQFYLLPTRLTTNWMSHPAFTPIRRASPPSVRYSFPVPPRVGGWVGLGCWLHTEVICSPEDFTPPDIDRVRCNFIVALILSTPRRRTLCDTSLEVSEVSRCAGAPCRRTGHLGLCVWGVSTCTWLTWTGFEMSACVA